MGMSGRHLDSNRSQSQVGASNLLNAALANLELFGQLPRSRPDAIARDQAAYVCLAQPVINPPDAWSLLRADVTPRISRSATQPVGAPPR
jgi:hypothetical protein